MTTVRSAAHPGFVEVTAPGLTAVVEVPDRHREALTAAAQDGLVALLDLLCSRGLVVMPAFAVVETSEGRARAVVRGGCRVLVDGGDAVTSQDRTPWRDVDLEPGGVLTVAAPEPEVPRGWRRPARLRGGESAAVAAATGAAAVTDGVDDEPPEPSGSRPEPVEQEPTEAEAVTAEPEPEELVPEEGLDVQPDEGSVEPVAVEPADAEAPVAEAADDAEAAPQPDLTLPPPEDSAGAPPVERVPATPPPERSIIDSVPWRRSGDDAEDRAAVPPPPTSTPEPVRTAALPVLEDPDASARPGPDPTRTPRPDPTPEAAPEPEPSGEASAPEVTTARADLPRSDEDLDRPVVLAVLCPAGHHSPPHAGRCRTCGREIPPQQPVPVPRPPLGVLRISTGGVVPLDRGVLLGRAPRVNEELPPAQRPHLVRVGGVDRDISRNHAEVVIEGWHVLVRDLGSTNGTTVALPGEDPVRLRPTEDHGIEPGTVVTLADEVSLTFEVDG
ncbi:FHA domain-containing protein [Phycicoccus sp. BSK3Z-2]|uniref:FHA domain-containing protein n=1 Tax=Phycicoccus avicenniae TaxID=2828860 RepID=A0A941D5Q9_9MICO|nr:FHA domain-containing protein [Phycicoccus avicenniae]MBR7742619.1 FHA domain-containing protein [Phycicoccus avicenniae]